MKEKLLRPLPMLAAGMALGVVSRLLDIYTSNLGNLFSSLPVWVLLGTLIAVYSPTAKRAAINILPFCMGMLLTYYLAAHISGGVYGWGYTLFWTLFALCTPLCAFIAWFAKEPGTWPKLLSAAIIIGTIAVSCIFFDKLRLHDIAMLLILCWLLFGTKPRRA